MTTPRFHSCTFCLRLSRIVSLACALFVVLSASRAAATAVPLCDELAQSIAAPPPLMPSHNGEIRQVPCAEERVWLFDLGSAPVRSPQSLITAPTPERALAWFDNLPPLTRDGRIDVPRREPHAPRSGFDDGIYRPPRFAS